MDLSRTIGDTVRFPMLAPLTGHGRIQTATATNSSGKRALEGNEEAMTQYSWAITLFEWAHSVRTIGKLMERQPAFSVSDSMTANLGLWWAKILDEATYDVMAGLGLVDDASAAIVTAAAPSRKLTGGTAAGTTTFRTTDAAIVTGEYISFEMIDRARTNAMSDASGPTIRPVIVDGMETYFCFMSTKQANDLRNDAGASVNITWKEAQMQAASRGRDNLIFRNNFLGFYNNVALFEYPNVATRTGDGGGEDLTANTLDTGDVVYNGTEAHRALFCGACAAVHAYGSMPDFVDETFEYKTQRGRSLQTIIAIGRPEFNAIDYGVSVLDTDVSVKG